jgi:tetratricopeptide (TPR) repeat protein
VNEQHYQTYINLIESLLKCGNSEEISAIFNNNQAFVDSDLVRIMLQVAANLKSQGNIDACNYLTNIAVHLLVIIENKFLYQNNLSKAREFYEESLTIVKKIDTDLSKLLQVDILNYLGNSYKPPHDWNLDKAIEVCEKSLGIAKDIGYLHGEAVALSYIGKAYYCYPAEKRNFPKAIECYEQAKAIFQQTENTQGVINALYHLQDSYYYTSDYARAIESNDELLVIARDLKNFLLEATALFCLGTNYQALDQLAEAKKYYKQSLQITNQLDIDAGGELKVNSLQGLGSYYMRKRELAKARKYYEDSLNVTKEILGIAKNKNNNQLREMTLQKQANALQPLAVIDYNQGKLDQAWDYNEQSLKIKLELQDQIGTGSSIGFRGSIYLVRGRYTEALECFEQSLRIMEQLKNLSGKASTLTDMGVAYLGLNQIEEAENRGQMNGSGCKLTFLLNSTQS